MPFGHRKDCDNGDGRSQGGKDTFMQKKELNSNKGFPGAGETQE